MKVFVFDLLPYSEHLDHLKSGKELHFKPEVAVRTYSEQLAMLDCMSNGRIVSGFARGIPREHNVYRVPLADSRARFEEAWEIIYRAWTEEVFSYEGRFWSYRDVAIWPRPVQQPHPPVWVAVTGSKETIEWAGRHNATAT